MRALGQSFQHTEAEGVREANTSFTVLTRQSLLMTKLFELVAAVFFQHKDQALA